MRVVLTVKGGGFVASFKIPQFNAWPGVLLWGDRTFTFVDDNLILTDRGESIAYYVEAFSYYIVRSVSEYDEKGNPT